MRIAEGRVVQVWVKILEVREDPNGNLKINCSARAVDQESGQDLDPDNRLAFMGGGPGGGPRDGSLRGEPPEVGSIHRATVAAIKPFGVFVRIQGFRSNGLVHFTQVGPWWPARDMSWVSHGLQISHVTCISAPQMAHCWPARGGLVESHVARHPGGPLRSTRGGLVMSCVPLHPGGTLPASQLRVRHVTCASSPRWGL
jgi:hypothetical protein